MTTSGILVLTVGRVQWPTNENRKCLFFEVAKTLFEAAEILFIKGKLEKLEIKSVSLFFGCSKSINWVKTRIKNDFLK